MHRIRRALAARAPAALLVLVAVLPVPSARAEGRYALVVGVEKYNPRFLVPLDHAEDDMERVGAALERLGFNVVTMTSAAEIPERRPVSAEDILNEVDRRLKNREPTDTIVLAFSGHGVQLKREAGREARETWFCPERARLDDPATLLPLSQVLDRLKACPAKQKLLLVDACRVEVEPKAIRDKSGVPTIELDAAAPFRRQLPEGMAALFSCGPHQKSFELPETGGVFTHFVVEYLEGRADPSRYRRGEATVQELAAYVSRQTTDHVDQRLREDQEPELVLPAGRLTDWPLGRLGDLASVDRRPAMPRPVPSVPPVPKPSPQPAAGPQPGGDQNAVFVQYLNRAIDLKLEASNDKDFDAVLQALVQSYGRRESAKPGDVEFAIALFVGTLMDLSDAYLHAPNGPQLRHWITLFDDFRAMDWYSDITDEQRELLNRRKSLIVNKLRDL